MSPVVAVCQQLALRAFVIFWLLLVAAAFAFHLFHSLPWGVLFTILAAVAGGFGRCATVIQRRFE